MTFEAISCSSCVEQEKFKSLILKNVTANGPLSVVRPK